MLTPGTALSADTVDFKYAFITFQAQMDSFASSFLSKRKYIRSRLGMLNTHCRCGNSKVFFMFNKHNMFNFI